MSCLSAHQSVFRVSKNGPLGSDAHRDKRRNRQAVSCTACRGRKLKCDRQRPCTACEKRGAPCEYSSSPTQQRCGQPNDSKNEEARLRLQRLEKMVSSLVSTASNGSTPDKHSLPSTSIPTPPPVTDTTSHGHLNLNGTESQYKGATHWATILEDIRDIQGVLGINQEDTTATADQNALPKFEGLDISLDTSRPLTIEDVLSTLPPRPVVDRLLSIYFAPGYLQPPVVHKTKFAKEIEAFWQSPSSASFLWISLLFSALWIACRISPTGGEDIPARDLFFTRAGQALVTGKYQKARPYSVEALLLHCQCRYMFKEDPDASPWLIMGITTRLALRMGYHRDPRQLANISPFEGEMRRRVFSIVEAFDLLLSFQAGLPAVIQQDECDCEDPSNLYDEDFTEDCKTLPPSRSYNDPTPLLYWCYKLRLSKVTKRVISRALSLRKASYEDAMQMDKDLRAIHDRVPQSLSVRPITSSFTDQVHTILHRINIDLLYQKSLCILHRPALTQDRSSPQTAYARRTCTDAALKVLGYQAELYEACQVGGRFHGNVWVLNSLVLHDFLLAAMITALDLYETYTRKEILSSADRNSQAAMYDALRLSHAIWQSRRSFSPDARRASNVLAIMLSKFPRPGDGDIRPQSGSSISDTPSNSIASTEQAPGMPSPLVWDPPTYNMLDYWKIVRPTMDQNDSLDFDTTDPVNMMFADSDTIDWGALDQYLLDPIDDMDFLVPDPHLPS